MVMSALFHGSLSLMNYDERSRLARNHSRNDGIKPLVADGTENSPKKKNFFKALAFYQMAMLFVVARFFMQSATIYMPVWLDERVANSKGGGTSIEDIATVPLASFIASLVVSIIYKQIYQFIGHRVGYFMGCCIGIAGCVWVVLDPEPTLVQLYLISVGYGSCHSILMIASLSMIADMIGSNTGQSGAVYAVVTFFAKLSTGIAIYIFESM